MSLISATLTRQGLALTSPTLFKSMIGKADRWFRHKIMRQHKGAENGFDIALMRQDRARTSAR